MSQPRTLGKTSLTIEHGPHRGLSMTEIRKRIGAMTRALQLKNVETSFVLTNDDRIQELNRIYRGKDRPTDVLAFAMREGELGALAGAMLGDVIVSVPTARRQADERDIPVQEEVTMLLAHGLLHLLGWDHDTAAKDRRMRAETARLCRAAGASADVVDAFERTPHVDAEPAGDRKARGVRGAPSPAPKARAARSKGRANRALFQKQSGPKRAGQRRKK